MACASGQSSLNCSSFFRLPILPTFLRKFRWEIQVSAREVKNVRRGDHCHFHCQQIIVPCEQLGDAEASHFGDLLLLEAKVGVPLAAVRSRGGQDFQSAWRNFALAIEHDYDTMNSEAEPLSRRAIVLLGERIGSLQQLVLVHAHFFRS